MVFLGNYFGAGPAYGPETQEQYEKRMKEESYGPGLPSDSTYEKKWKGQEEEQAAKRARETEQWWQAAGRGAATAINIYGQAEAGRPVLPSGGTGPRVTAGGGTYGPGYSEPGSVPQPTDSFISRNKWLLVGAGGGVAVLFLTTILLLKRKKKEF